MKAIELELGHQITGTFSCPGVDGPLPVGTLVSFRHDPSGEPLLAMPGGAIVVPSPLDGGARSVLDQLASDTLARLSWVAGVQGTTLVVHTHLFARQLSFATGAPLRLQVDERIADDLPRRWRDDPLGYFRDEFLLEDHAFGIVHEEGASTDLRLIGQVRTAEFRSDDRSVWRCVRIVRRRRHAFRHEPVALLRGAIEFVDSRRFAGEAQAIREELGRIVGHAGSYLRGWDIYNDLEEQIRLEEARALRSIPYRGCRRHDRGESTEYHFQLAGPVPAALEAQAIELAAGLTPLIEDEQVLVAVG